MGDAAVRAATGKGWNDWFKMLDAAGCRTRDHREIVAELVRLADPGAWWRQMITVGYEQARGLRRVHEKPSGFEISRSKTLAASAAKAYRAWTDAATRAAWLPQAEFTIRKATAGKSLRITWSNAGGNVEVMLYPKGAGRCQMTVQHGKLASAAAAERMKAFWGQRLEALAESFGAEPAPARRGGNGRPAARTGRKSAARRARNG
ncbi:MAG: hypothetical protein U1A27_10815 [Phycisphaerae bacterium]